MWLVIVPDAGVVFSGDLVEYKSACYCGDAHFTDYLGLRRWIISPNCRPVCLCRTQRSRHRKWSDGTELTADFVSTFYIVVDTGKRVSKYAL